MRLTKTSSLSGTKHTMEIPISIEEYVTGHAKMAEGMHIQNVFPQLSADQREFLLTGITPEEWDEAFKDED